MPLDRIRFRRALRPPASFFLLAVIMLASAVQVSPVHAQTAEPAPKKQLPADDRAFTAARATVDPEQRLAAMRSFTLAYPKSSHVGRAEEIIYSTLIEEFPTRIADIDAQAKLLIKRIPKRDFTRSQESWVAWELAEVDPAGIDLAYAENLAKDAVDHQDEAADAKETVASYTKAKIPPPKPEELHKQFNNTRADALAVLADVYLRQGKQPQAAALITEAFALDPLVDDVNSQRGRLALLDHNDALAIESFERAQLTGTLARTDREKLIQLYLQAHNGSAAGLPDEMDALYARLHPPPFTPAKPLIPSTGHTALLELYTGSACPPCVGGDLAVEGLLEAYPRTEIVALAFDQHIPEPDPLANPDSIARADFNKVESTPTFILDGKVLPMYGSDRDGSKALYDRLAKFVDTQAAIPTGVQLNVSAHTAPDSSIHAHAILTLPSEQEIEKTLAAKPPAPAAAAKSAKAEDHPATPPIQEATPAEPHLTVNFALVEDDVRYSGENGIRFHRMLVRALAKPADAGFAVTPGSTLTLDAAFDPATIIKALATYLDGYEQQNNRFGKIKFITKDMTMRPDHLAVAAWVEDSITHKVLEAALTSVAAIGTDGGVGAVATPGSAGKPGKLSAAQKGAR